MSEQASPYVNQTPEGGWRLAGTRVSLDSIVHAYWEGRMPETIAADLPSLSLEQIHGAIAYYLGHREEIDRYLTEQDSRWQQLQQESAARHGLLIEQLRARSRAKTLPGS
jgi:uncharacterized protein (DUF433 family)